MSVATKNGSRTPANQGTVCSNGTINANHRFKGIETYTFQWLALTMLRETRASALQAVVTVNTDIHEDDVAQSSLHLVIE